MASAPFPITKGFTPHCKKTYLEIRKVEMKKQRELKIMLHHETWHRADRNRLA